VTTTETIPTLTTITGARAMLEMLAEDHDWVSVFWDRGWGDSGQTAEISIIVDGNGQDPRARITAEVYKALREQNIVGENTLMTFKARRVHDFKTPPKDEPSGPNPAEVAEQAIRRYMADHPEQPILAEFYRGLSRDGSGYPQVDHEYAETPAAGDNGWYVLILPGHSDAAISAQKPDFLGHTIIGGGVADTFQYPHTGNGDVDVEALAGGVFQAQLAAAIGDKVAVIEAERVK
jgi:hypothetical protein